MAPFPEAARSGRRNGLAGHGAAAEAAGANLVTGSGTRLIAAITKTLGLKT